MELPNILIEKIESAIESKPQPLRHHIGPSSAGKKCDRWLWLNFRWAVREKFHGRILRLFQRGHDEEPRVIEWLRLAGLVITETGDNQRTIDFGGHISGSIDGIIISGVPESPTKKHVLEIKTHNKKSFDDLEKNGVEKSKYEHFLQMQCYMYGANIDRALYVAVCKDDDRIYIERIKLKSEIAVSVIARLKRISMEETIPAPISENPTWYECKMCAAHDFCHVSKKIKPETVSCRTCAHSTPTDQGTWICERHGGKIIGKEFQEKFCRSHVIHPDLINKKLDMEKSTEWTACYDGEMNGEDGYDSKSFLLGDDAMKVAKIFEGKVL